MAIDPLTIGSIALTGLKTLGGFLDKRSEANTSDFNSAILSGEASSIINAGNISARQQEQEAEKIIGRQLLTYAKAGLTLEGAPSSVIAETAKNLRHNILMTRLNAATEASRIRGGIINEELKAARARSQSFSILTSRILDVGSTLLTRKLTDDANKAIVSRKRTAQASKITPTSSSKGGAIGAGISSAIQAFL